MYVPSHGLEERVTRDQVIGYLPYCPYKDIPTRRAFLITMCFIYKSVQSTKVQSTKTPSHEVFFMDILF